MPLRTEDQVRNEAGITLGFIDASGNNVDTSEYLSGVGQLTTFIQLGSRLGTTDFAGISDKPDGWLMPFNQNGVAIVRCIAIRCDPRCCMRIRSFSCKVYV